MQCLPSLPPDEIVFDPLILVSARSPGYELSVDCHSLVCLRIGSTFPEVNDKSPSQFQWMQN